MTEIRSNSREVGVAATPPTSSVGGMHINRGAVNSIARNRVDNALAIAIKGLDNIDAHGKYWNASDDPYQSLTEKIIVETGLLALIVTRIPEINVSTAGLLNKIADRLESLARSSEKAALLVKYPHVALPFGIAHLALEELQRPDPRFSSVLHRALFSHQIDSMERLPYRKLEVEWLRAALTGEPLPPHVNLCGSIISGYPHPLHMSIPDVYALTHTLFYLSDFGRSSVQREDVDLTWMRNCVDSCLAWQLFEQNVDTVGELIISAIALSDGSLTATSAACWGGIEKLWDLMGFVPGPNFDANHFGSISGPERDSYAFQNSYHTIFVAGIMNAILLQKPSLEIAIDADALGASVASADIPLLAEFATKFCGSLPKKIVAEAAILQPGRDARYLDLQSALDAHSSSATPSTVIEARNLLDRHLTMLQMYPDVFTKYR